jgi:hypothetical protein
MDGAVGCSKEDEELKGDLGGVNFALAGVVVPYLGQTQVRKGHSILDKDGPIIERTMEVSMEVSGPS